MLFWVGALILFGGLSRSLADARAGDRRGWVAFAAGLVLLAAALARLVTR